MIKLQNITKSFGTLQVLQGIDLEIAKGEFVALVGKSGSGKSTILNIIGALDKPTSGNVFIDTEDLSTLSDKELALFRSTSLGFVFQSFHLEPTYSVFKNIEIPLLIAKVPKKERIAKIQEVLAKVNLSDKIKQKTATLSGGEKQRVAIARSLANSPKIILADEPTGNLDSQSGKIVLDLLKDLSSSGITVLLVTHSESDAGLADRVISLEDGKIASPNKANEK